VKRRDLVKKLEDLGCVLIRHGGKHDWYQNPVTKVSQPVPRHKEVNETPAKIFLKSWGIADGKMLWVNYV